MTNDLLKKIRKVILMNIWKQGKVPESLWGHLNQSAKEGSPPPLCLELQVSISIYTNPRCIVFS